jgi:hypothetical protein
MAIRRKPPATTKPDGAAVDPIVEDTRRRQMLPNWRGLGFVAAPIRSLATGAERVYRVHGGATQSHGKPGGQGVFFSWQRPRRRWEAERLFAIAEWGNALLHVSTFTVPEGTPMWIGRVDPGDSYQPGWGATGSQVYVQNPWAMRMVRVEVPPLLDDMRGVWVHTGGAGNA